jgi:hypothetical protein
MTAIKKCGGFTSSSSTDLVFAYYTWCIVAANAVGPVLTGIFPREEDWDQAAAPTSVLLLVEC